MHYVYIIYSRQIDRFYIGESENPDMRLIQHNNKEFKSAFTSQTNDWELKCKYWIWKYYSSQKSGKFCKKNEIKKIQWSID